MYRTSRASLLAALVLLPALAASLPAPAFGQQGKPPAPAPIPTQAAAKPPNLANPTAPTNPSQPQACGPIAGVVPGVDVLGYNNLFDVDGSSSNDIWAIGSYHNSAANAFQPLIEHWDGQKWSQVPGPSANNYQNTLRSLDVIDADDAWAVGDYVEPGGSFTRGLTMHWDGTQWSIVPTPVVTDVYAASTSLVSVAAVSSDDVWAGAYVRYTPDSQFPYGYTQHLQFLHWDGSAWGIVEGPEVMGTPVVKAITAVASDDVWAVGYEHFMTANSRALILHWDGVAWSQVPVSEEMAFLYAVDAVSANDIWAVGSTTGEPDYGFGSAAVLMHWDGQSWSKVPGPLHTSDPASDSHLNGVVALASNDVWAVGSYWVSPNTPEARELPLTMHWDGTKWSLVYGPEPPLPPGGSPYYNNRQSRLYGVMGLSSNEVWAVGAQGEPQTLIERWDGTSWQSVPSVDPGLAANFLADIDAYSPDDIWSVGYYTIKRPSSFYNTSTLVQHWDGSTWTTIPSPNTSMPESFLAGVAALSPMDVWAVGTTGIGGSGDYSTLVMHWDGAEWTVIPSPNGTVRGQGDNYLQSVDGIAPDDVWAVGYYSPLGGGLEYNGPIIEHWDGNEWSIVPPPELPDENVHLSAVDAIAADDVWAVGSVGLNPLAMHWNGAEWTIVTLPTKEAGWLQGVAAISGDDVWAVGNLTDTSTDTSRTLTLHWDGTTWTQVSSPNIAGVGNTLYDVSASSSTDVWAAGMYNPTGVSARPLLLRWDGATWESVLVPNPGSLHTSLQGVEALAPDDVWAVGTHANTGDSRTLIEHVGIFRDVVPTDYFYDAVSYLATNGIVSGYDNCTFRPGNNTSRGQLAKMVVLAQGWQPLEPGNPTFADVLPGSPFYGYVEAAASRGVLGGYPCGNPEPCDAGNRPYFRPGEEVTRGQLAKIVVASEGWKLLDPEAPAFTDVPRDAPFYRYVETARSHGLLGGYSCGSPEPCDAQNRAYFRPGNPATRGQVAKIIYNAVTAPE